MSAVRLDIALTVRIAAFIDARLALTYRDRAVGSAPKPFSTRRPSVKSVASMPASAAFFCSAYTRSSSGPLILWMNTSCAAVMSTTISASGHETKASEITAAASPAKAEPCSATTQEKPDTCEASEVEMVRTSPVER